MDLKRLPDGTDECLACHFKGIAREGNIQQINEYRKRLGPVTGGGKESLPSQTGAPGKPLKPGTQEDLKKRLESLKSKQFEGIEFL